jgi:hypothetical protein
VESGSGGGDGKGIFFFFIRAKGVLRHAPYIGHFCPWLRLWWGSQAPSTVHRERDQRDDPVLLKHSYVGSDYISVRLLATRVSSVSIRGLTREDNIFKFGSS